MSTWPSQGPPVAPAGRGQREVRNPKTVRPVRSDSRQQASMKPEAINLDAPMDDLPAQPPLCLLDSTRNNEEPSSTVAIVYVGIDAKRRGT